MLAVVAGGTPTPPELAALAAAIAALEDERAARAAAQARPVPAAYRSRWRRAGLVEATAVPAGAKDTGVPWNGGL